MKTAEIADDALKAKYDAPEWMKGDSSKTEQDRARDACLYDNTVGGMTSGKSMKELREKYAQAVEAGIAGAKRQRSGTIGKWKLRPTVGVLRNCGRE
jgi:hypothetical protein